MAEQSTQGERSSRAGLYAIIVAVAVGAIYFINTTGMGLLLPEQYNVDLTAETTAVAQATQNAASMAIQEDRGNETAGGGVNASTADVQGAENADEPAREPAVAPAEKQTATPRPRTTPTATFPARVNGLPTIAYDSLPPEAWDTIELIGEGGPFPFDRDGGTFENREGLLPDEYVGYYSDYTVRTPGVGGRGERRIIQGEGGELYYTDDRYESFSFVVSAPTETVAASPTRQPTRQPTSQPTATPRQRTTPTATFPSRVNGLPTIAFDDLPPEAWDTIELIDRGGPFPFDRDGITFENREGLLPDEYRGYYSEFTVITPGVSTRGARRIIQGEEGELYYTDDHYDSFSYVVR